MRIHILFIAVILSFVVFSCQKENNAKLVKYVTTEAISMYDLAYLNGSSQLIEQKVEAQSAQDKWVYSFEAEPGDIVYVSAKYYDIESALKIQILIDGKVYKEKSSRNDTTQYLTVSGVIPYE